VKVLEKQANGNPITNPDNAELKQSPDFEDMTELLEYCLRHGSIKGCGRSGIQSNILSRISHIKS